MPHTCDHSCSCPVHKTPLIYSSRLDEHACRDPACQFAHGMDLEQRPAETYPAAAATVQALGGLAEAMKDVSRFFIVDSVKDLAPPAIPGNRRFRRSKRKSRYAVPGIVPGPVPELDGIVVWGPFSSGSAPHFTSYERGAE